MLVCCCKDFDFMKSKEELLFHLEEATGVLKSPSLKKAYLQIDRKDFVLPKYEDEAYEDHPLPIGYGQTISQPTTVFFMLELLSAKLGDHILDVGSGSGWTTALLGSIVGKKGGVVGVDIVSELVEYGRNNLKKYKKLNAKVINFRDLGNDRKYDKILISADTEKLPEMFMNMLKIGGVIVFPTSGVVTKITKRMDKIEKEEYPGFAFVPYLDN